MALPAQFAAILNLMSMKFITQNCAIYQTKGISMPYNIDVALPYQKM